MTDRLTLSAPEAAERLGVHRSTICRLAQDGTLPHVRIGRRLLISRAGLDDYVAKQLEPWTPRQTKRPASQAAQLRAALRRQP